MFSFRSAIPGSLALGLLAPYLKQHGPCTGYICGLTQVVHEGCFENS